MVTENMQDGERGRKTHFRQLGSKIKERSYADVFQCAGIVVTAIPRKKESREAVLGLRKETKMGHGSSRLVQSRCSVDHE